MKQNEEIEFWKKLLSCKRINDIKNGKETTECFDDPRNPFQRDCDRITYSYPFRRLQDKTQVIPLPVIDFVHTRLTHTLEVATVGRSLGKLLENHLIKKGIIKIENSGSVSAIVAAACLAHDIGNPPFGHSGEDSIAEFFTQGEGLNMLESIYRKEAVIEENFKQFIDYKPVSVQNECKINDLQKFEGNAMGFRLLTKHDETGLNLTCATLATFTKYPRQSYIEGEYLSKRWSERISQKKYGFFQTEIEEFKIIAKEVGLKELLPSNSGNYSWARHPLAFLMEAADDICYGIIDLEDGFRIGKIPFNVAEESLLKIAKKDERFELAYYDSLKGEKKKFSYLRAKNINLLIQKTFDVFIKNYDSILYFDYDNDLIKDVDDKEIIDALEEIKSNVRKYIYNWQDVLTVEAAGFEVLGELIKLYIDASNICLSCPPDTRSKRASKIFNLLAEEYRQTHDEEEYSRYLKIACYVSGMTDSYAIILFQKIKGIIT